MYGDAHEIELSTNNIAKKCYSLGNYEIDDYTKIGIFEVQVKDNIKLARNRVGLRNVVEQITRQVAGAMVVFVQEDKWRFSYISKRKVLNTATNLIEDKQTNARRYTYLFGKGEKALTAAQRFDKLIQKQQGNLYQFLDLRDFEEAFSVEKLSKDFFKYYKEIYEDFVEFLTGKRYAKKGNRYVEQRVGEANWQLTHFFEQDDKQARDFCKRMMGRIVFLYFVQKKGWLAVPKDKTWGQGNPDYLYNLFQHSKHQDDFYYQELVPLFFNSLNNSDSENPARDRRYPYLNGGLFDPAQDSAFNKLQLPEHIFQKLFERFNEFNFTIYEDAPDEHTVAVDPEMLGHIFENLLEDNKAKGAFYTPKEIVHYMCRESLSNYIYAYAKKENDEQFKAKLNQYFEDYDVKKLSNEEIKNIDRALEDVKICDPAIGSGAFPMGLLHEIYNLKIPIEDNKGFKAKSPAVLKKHIIEESIYGVDIDAGAVDISRLRFWLSLIVDEESPQPLPNLNFKIVCANSLIPLGDITGFDMDERAAEARNDLEALRNEFFNTSSEEKLKLERKFKKIQTELLGLRELATSENYDIYTKLYEFNPFDDNSCSWFDPWWMFGVNNSFDIVIGNPPYGAKLDSDHKKLFKDLYSDVHMRTPDTFNYFISKSFRLLKDGGVLSFIVPNNLLFQGENSKTRDLLINKNQLRRVINLGDNTFESADVPTCIFVATRTDGKDYQISYSDNRKENIHRIDFFDTQKEISSFEVNMIPDLVIGIGGSQIKIIKDIDEKSFKIDDIALEVASGISTGGDKIFRISESFMLSENLEHELLRPVLVGAEIDKYSIKDTQYQVIYTARDTKIDNYPNIKQYLTEFKDKLENRSEARSGVMPWFSLNRQRYPLLFEETKIIMRQTSDSIRATIDNSGFYCLDSILVFKIEPRAEVSYRYALLMLNSKLNHLVYKNLTQEEGRVFAQVKPQNVRKLYIPKITLDEQKIFNILCDYLMFLNNPESDQVSMSTDNKAVAHYLQQVIDASIVELIYGSEMTSQNVNILKYVTKDLGSFEGPVSGENIGKVFNLWSMPESEVRNRLKIISLMCPDTAGKILNPSEED
ncbi:Eco57I restriction-modification methylase domain-containing protein [Pedobacter paludis]|uniref:Eco57I restriction-modification methylase domain-containing protein n=1 Tax=Pedobacter paludis TaxID=2203212 RepID=UPI0013145FAD|nr:N-6 DNA methylase [Pedobacter paludis]